MNNLLNVGSFLYGIISTGVDYENKMEDVPSDVEYGIIDNSGLCYN